MGDERTAADLSLFMFTRWGRRLEPASWTRPNIRGHFERALQLPGVRRMIEEQGLELPRLGGPESMCFDLDSEPADPRDRGRRGLARGPRPERGRRQRVRGVPRGARRAVDDRGRHPPRRARPLPLLRGARAALRRARPRRGRDRLLRAHRRRGEARRRLRLHAARRADDAGRGAGRRRARRSRSCASRGATSIFTVGFCFGGRALVARGRRRPRPRRRDRLLRLADARTRRRRAVAARRARSAARSSRCRPATTRASPPRTTPRSTQALSAAGVEHEVVVYDGAPHSFFDRKQEEFAGGVGRRLAANAGVHRRALVILAIDQGTTGTTCLVVDETLQVLRRGYAELPQHFPRPGWVEHDPDEIWQSVARCAARRRRARRRRRRGRRSRTSARRRCSGTARRGGRWRPQSSGRTAAPPSAAASSTRP